MEKFAAPTIIKAGKRASFKLPYLGKEPVKIQWFHDGEELAPDTNIQIFNEEGHTCLVFTGKLQRKDTGEIKIKIKNEFGTVEAVTQLIVLGK